MLRHYDELGLLHPAAVDETTGYRYYSEEQLRSAAEIHFCRSMGLGIAGTADYLSAADDGARLRILAGRRAELRAQLTQNRQYLCALENEEKRLRKEGKSMIGPIAYKTMPRHFAACVRRVIPSYMHEGALWRDMMQETAPLGVRMEGHSMAFFHDAEYRESDVDVEVRMAVDRIYPDTEHVRFCEIPAFDYVSVMMYGGYEQSAAANAALAGWIRENRRTFAGAMFNIYHVSPAQTQNPDELVTEVCIPVRAAE